MISLAYRELEQNRDKRAVLIAEQGLNKDPASWVTTLAMGWGVIRKASKEGMVF